MYPTHFGLDYNHGIMKRRILYTVVFLFSFMFSLTAQLTVSGGVTDQQGYSMTGVNVVLLYMDSTVCTGTVSDAHGRFSITKVSAGSYILRCSMVGYANVWQMLDMAKDTVLPDIVLKEGVELEGIAVESVVRRSFATRDEIYLTKDILEKSVTALDAVTQLSEFRRVGWNEIAASDDSPMLIVIDDRIVTADELLTLDPSKIKKVISHKTPPLRYKSYNVQRVLEIVTDRPRARTYDLNLMTNDNFFTWLESSDYASFIYNDSLNRFGLDYGYMYQNNSYCNTLPVQNTNIYSYMQTDGQWITNQYRTYNMQRLKSSHTPNIYYQRFTSDYTLIADVNYQDVSSVDNLPTDIEIATHTSAPNYGKGQDSLFTITRTASANLYFAYDFGNERQFVVDIIGSFSQSGQDNNLWRQMNTPDPTMDYNYTTALSNLSYSAIAEAGYYGKLWGGEWNIGGKYMYKRLNQTYSFLSQDLASQPSETSTKQYFMTEELYAAYEKNWNKTGLSGSFHLNNTTYWLQDTTYNFFIPTFSLYANHNFSNTLSLSASTSLFFSAPDLSDLSNAASFKDKYFIMIGNPHLKPSYGTQTSIRMNLSNKKGTFSYMPFLNFIYRKNHNVPMIYNKNEMFYYQSLPTKHYYDAMWGNVLMWRPLKWLEWRSSVFVGYQNFATVNNGYGNFFFTEYHFLTFRPKQFNIRLHMEKVLANNVIGNYHNMLGDMGYRFPTNFGIDVSWSNNIWTLRCNYMYVGEALLQSTTPAFRYDEHGNYFNSSHVIFVGATYHFHYGDMQQRNTKKRINNADNDSGIISSTKNLLDL